MTNTPEISVIVPTCHRNDLLAKCLDCLAPGAQPLPPEQYEVIVTDDGSRSTAEQMVREHYPWARWVAGPRRGPAANRNHGTTFARGEWLAFTDDDCLPSPGWLQAFVAAIEQDTSIYEGKTTCREGLASPLYEAPINLTGGNLWSCNFLIAQSVFQEMGGFDENFTMPAVEDTDLRERLEQHGENRKFVEDAIVDHPPRRQPSGRRLGEKYQANVQYWYKTGHRGSFFVPFLKHIKHRIYMIRQFRFSKDFLLALLTLAVEACFIAARLPRWQRQFEAAYHSRSQFPGRTQDEAAH